MIELEKETRTNAHMSNNALDITPIKVHIFGGFSQNQDQQALTSMFQQQNYEFYYHVTLQELFQLRQNKSNTKTMIILITSCYSEEQLKQELQKTISDMPGQSKVHIYTYPTYYSSLNVEHLGSAKEAVAMFGKLKEKRKKQKTIRLSQVYSIDKSHSSSKDITKISTSHLYSSIKYITHSQYNTTTNTLYDKLTQIFANQNTYEPIADPLLTIKNTKEEEENKKILMVIPSHLAEQVIKTIKSKKKEDLIDLIVVGPLQPNNAYLSKTVVLASNEPQKVYDYLKSKNIVSKHLISQMFLQIIADNAPASQKNIGNSQSQGQNILLNAFGFEPNGNTLNQPNQQDPISISVHQPQNKNEEKPGSEYQISNIASKASKSKVKKIKSPGRSRPQPEITQSQHNQSINNVRLSQNIAATSPNISQPQGPMHHNYHTTHDISHTEQKRHPFKRNTLGNPSVVIHQTSDQYRGSNKDSLVNNEKQSQIKNKRFQKESPSNGPQQQITQKKIVNNISTNSPQTQYIQSNQHITQYHSRQTVQKPYQQRQQPYQQRQQTYQYSSNGYQSPNKIIRKAQHTQPEQIRAESTKNIEEYRYNHSYQQNEQHVPTVTYYDSKHQHQPTRQLRTQYTNNNSTNNISRYNQANYSSPYRNTTTTTNVQPYTSKEQDNGHALSSSRVNKAQVTKTNVNQLNLDGYERFEENGRTVYRKKAVTSPQTKQITHNRQYYNSISNQSDRDSKRDSSPKVMRYEVSPRRQAETIKQQFSRPSYGQGITQRYVSASSTYNPSEKGQVYDSGLRALKNNQEVNVHEPSHKIESISTDNRFTFRGGTTKNRADVERYEVQDNKLEAGSPNSRALNDSNWLTKPSQIYSDGSIMRRNNIRFGIKTKKRDQRQSQNSVMQNKLGSGIYTVKDLNKKMALTRKIKGEQQLFDEELKYLHLNPSLTGFHYLFQEELKYFKNKISTLFGKQDKIDDFLCVQDVIQLSKRPLPCGLIILKEDEAAKFNPSMLPQDYYLVLLKGSQPCLQLNQQSKTIIIDSLKRLPLVQKIILNNKLYQYIVYIDRPSLQAFCRKFNNTEFIVQKIEVDLTIEYLDCYYYEQPQLTRLYLVCEPQDLKEIQSVIHKYKKANPSFEVSSLRLICVTYQNQAPTFRYPYLNYYDRDQPIDYEDIITNVHRSDKQIEIAIRPDKLFIHQQHENIIDTIQQEFPKRFEVVIFKTLAEISRKVLKPTDKSWSSYLILHQSLNGEKILTEKFTKVFMLGRVKTIPPNVVRVMRKEELIELLRK